MTTNKKLSLSDRFGIMNPSKTAMEEDTCEAADSFRDEYIKIIMTRQPTTTDCFSSSMLITSDDDELDLKMEDSWKEHFETCLKENTWSKKEHMINANHNDNIVKALKTTRTESGEQHECWKENCCQNQTLDLFKAAENVGILFKAEIPEEKKRSDTVATRVLGNTKGKNLNKGQMQEHCKIISKSKTCVVEETKQINRKDEMIVSFSTPPKRKWLSDEGSEESYVSPLDAVYETKLAENSSVFFQKDKLICDLRTRFTNAPLKQPRAYPCQNDGSTDQGDIRGNSSVNRNGFEQEISPTMSPFFNNPFTSDTSNCPQERVTSTQNLSHNLMERDLEIVMHSPSAFSSSETSNYNFTLSHGYTSNSQDNVSELELLERTLNVPSGFYAKKICKNSYKPPEMSQPMERSFMSMAPGLYRERCVGHSNHKEKSFESSPGKEELFQTLLQQCSALVHTTEDHDALEAVISLISQQAGGHLDMNQDARISNAVSTMKRKEQLSEKDIVAESCHSTTIDDNTEIGSSPEEALSSSHRKGDLFEGRTLLKGGVQPRHIPKTYIPKPNRELPFDPRRRPNIDKMIIISLPMPKFYAEIFKLKKAGKLDASFKPKKSELLEISCFPKNMSHDGEGPISDCIVYDDRSISGKFLVEDTPAVMGTPVKDEKCDKDLMTTNNLNKCGSTSVVNKSSEMETTANMNDIIDKEYDGMQQNLCHTRRELMDKTFTNSIIWQERDVSEGRDKLPSVITKDEIDYVMESVSQLLTSLNDQVTAGLEQAKVEELEELRITKENTLEMTSIPIRENLKENVHSTDDQNIKSDKVMSSTKDNKVFIEDFVQMSPFNKDCTKSTEISVVKTLETSIADAAINEQMEHAIVPVSSNVNLRASISNTTVNARESVKTSNLNITATCTKRKPVFTFKLNKSLGHGIETSMSTQVQCDTIAVPTSEVFGSKHTSNTKEETIKEKQNPEVQTSIDLFQGQPFCDQSDFQKCELYDPNSPTETIVEEVSMELDSSMEEGEIQQFFKSDISSDAADTGDEKVCKGLEVVRSKWKETFYTFERNKEGKSISDELGLRKTLLESKKKDVEDLGGNIENDESCGTSKSQCAQEMRSSDHSCCDSQDSRSKGRCKMSQPMRKGSNDCEDRHRKSHASRRPRSRSRSYSRVQDSGSRSKRKGSNHVSDRHKRSKRSRSRSKCSSDYKDSNSRDRWCRSHSKRKYDRDGALIQCSPSRYEYSPSNSHCYYYDSCQSRSVRDSDLSSERSSSDDSLKRHTKDRGEETNARHHRHRKEHHNFLNKSREDHFVIHLKDSDSSRSSAYLSSKCSQSPAFEDVEKSFRKCRERVFKSTEQLETSASEMNRLRTAVHTETKTCRDDRQPSQLDWTPDEFVQMRRRSYEWQDWQYSYSHDTFEGNNITDYEGDSVPKMYRGKFANKCYNENIEQSWC